MEFNEAHNYPGQLQIQECGICSNQYKRNEIIILPRCFHKFCKKCVIQNFTVESQTSVKCPIANGSKRCANILLPTELRNIVAPNVFAQISRKIDYSDPVSSCSQNNDCNSWTCNKCTLINKVSDTYCAVCNNRNENVQIDESTRMTHEMNLAYLEHLTVDAPGCIENYEPFECLICLTEHKPKQGVMLQDCLHMFCKPCLAKHIQHSKEPQIHCPFIADKNRCEGVLQDREIKYLVGKEQYEKYVSYSVNSASKVLENTQHCKAPNCPGWGILDNNVLEFDCPVCGKKNCLQCNVIHDGMTCKEYNYRIQNDIDLKLTQEQLNMMLNTREARQCPYCHIAITKLNGCDNMVCGSCKRGFNWGQAGKRR